MYDREKPHELAHVFSSVDIHRILCPLGPGKRHLRCIYET